MSIGFEHAPVTQLLTLTVVVAGLFFGSSNLVAFDIFQIGAGQIWRVITGQLIFENMAQTVVGAMLLYTFRQFERQMGTKKFGCFVVIASLATTAVAASISVLAMSIEAVFVPASGPFALIFAALALFYARVPKLHASEYHVLGVGFSEKSWVYLLAAQLLFSAGLRSVLPALSGFVVGYLYDSNFFSLQSYRLPRVVETAFSAAGGFFQSLMPTGRGRRPGAAGGAAGGAAPARRPVGGGDGGGGGGVFGGAVGAGGPGGFGFGAAAPPSEDAITTLMGMGFDRAAVIRALENTGNNVEAAANLLLR